MATNTQLTNARQYPYELVHYVRFTVNWNDPGIASGVGITWLPAGALVLGTWCWVDTVFNAATTNVLTFGDATTFTQLAGSGDITEGTTGIYNDIKPNAAPFLTALTADTQLGVKYTQTGTAATTGKAYGVVRYIPNNDNFQSGVFATNAFVTGA